MGSRTVCLNCLELGAVSVPVGPEKGHQMDRYTDTISLCPLCRDALLAGNLQTLHDRYRDERIVSRGEFVD